MSAKYILMELTRIGIRSDGVKIKRCVMCSANIKEPDKDCPVCRVIIYLKTKQP